MSLKKKIIKGAKNKMSLVDILEGTAKLLGAGAIVYLGNELLTKYYIPWTKEVEKELDKHPELDGYRIDGKVDKEQIK